MTTMAVNGTRVKVSVRLRPIAGDGISSKDRRAVHVNSSTDLVVCSPYQKTIRSFSFDRIFDSISFEPESRELEQEEIFKEIAIPILDHALNGLNACLLAYGQTGSGKSYTMMGSLEHRGVIPRFMSALFDKMSRLDEAVAAHISYYEIYGEKVYDLLGEMTLGKRSGRALKIRENCKGTYVEGLTKVPISTTAQAVDLVETGNRFRTVASTKLNRMSSRSHAIVQISLVIDAKSENSEELCSLVNFVDLAGSERSGQAGTSGARLKEGSEINKSLTVLGRVIALLSERSAMADKCTKKAIIPYRESVLTWILRDSLGGNSMTSIVTTISPLSDFTEQTLSSLRFASSARAVSTSAVTNHIRRDTSVSVLKAELQSLKKMLASSNNQEMSDLEMRLREANRQLADMVQSWEVLANEKRFLVEREKVLQEYGVRIGTDSVDISIPLATPYFVNLHDDPQPPECLIYHIKEGVMSIGGANADIVLPGSKSCDQESCRLMHKNGIVEIEPSSLNSMIAVDGVFIVSKTVLASGSHVSIDGRLQLKFGNPGEFSHKKVLSLYDVDHRDNNEACCMLEPISPLVFESNGECFDSMNRITSQILSMDSDLGFPYAMPSKSWDLMRSGSAMSEESPLFNSEASSSFILGKVSLARKYTSIWRGSHLMRIVKEVMLATATIKHAHALLIKKGYDAYCQLMILDEYGYQISPCDRIRVVDNSAHPGMTSGISVQLWVRIMDFDSCQLRILPYNIFEDKLNGEATVGECGKKKRLEDDKVYNSCIGFADVYAVFPGSNFVEMVSPYTHAVCGALELRINATGVILYDILLSGFSSLVYGVHFAIYVISSQDGSILDETTALYSGDTEDIVVPELQDGQFLRIWAYGNPQREYLDELLCWDETQEPMVPGVDGAQEKRDGVFQTESQILELSEDGFYQPTEVAKSQSICRFLLHHGLQRKFRITFVGVNMGQLSQITTMFSKPKLVDPNEIVYDCGDDVFSVQGQGEEIIEEMNDVGLPQVTMECVWDSCLHKSGYLDRISKKGFTVMIDVGINGTFEGLPFSLNLSIRVEIVSRATYKSGIQWLFKGGTNENSLIKSVEYVYIPSVPRSLEDFFKIDPRFRTTGRKEEPEYTRPRGISLLREFYASRIKASWARDISLCRKRLSVSSVKDHGCFEPRHHTVQSTDLVQLLAIWKHPARSVDTRLKMWDYRETILRGCSQPNASGDRKSVLMRDLAGNKSVVWCGGLKLYMLDHAGSIHRFSKVSMSLQSDGVLSLKSTDSAKETKFLLIDAVILDSTPGGKSCIATVRPLTQGLILEFDTEHNLKSFMERTVRGQAL